MLRQFSLLARTLVAALVAAQFAAGCGIKGPLVPASTSGAAKETAKDPEKDPAKDKPSDAAPATKL